MTSAPTAAGTSGIPWRSGRIAWRRRPRGRIAGCPAERGCRAGHGHEIARRVADQRKTLLKRVERGKKQLAEALRDPTSRIERHDLGEATWVEEIPPGFRILRRAAECFAQREAIDDYGTPVFRVPAAPRSADVLTVGQEKSDRGRGAVQSGRFAVERKGTNETLRAGDEGAIAGNARSVPRHREKLSREIEAAAIERRNLVEPGGHGNAASHGRETAS